MHSAGTTLPFVMKARITGTNLPSLISTVDVNIPVLTQESLADYLPDDFYENPAIEAYKELNEASWKVAVNDDQINILDTYYTKLMSD